MIACENGHTEIVKALIEAPDIDLNQKNEVSQLVNCCRLMFTYCLLMI